MYIYKQVMQSSYSVILTMYLSKIVPVTLKFGQKHINFDIVSDPSRRLLV